MIPSFIRLHRIIFPFPILSHFAAEYKTQSKKAAIPLDFCF